MIGLPDRFSLVVERWGDGTWRVRCPELPDLLTVADSPGAAIARVPADLFELLLRGGEEGEP